MQKVLKFFANDKKNLKKYLETCIDLVVLDIQGQTQDFWKGGSYV